MNQTNPTPIKIVMADDIQIYREGLKVLIKNLPEIELLAEAENGRELLDMIREHKPDVAIVDIQMPVMDGIEACKQICQQFPDVPVIALSMFDQEAIVIDMLEAGAKGYLLKNTRPEEFLQAVKDVYGGDPYYSSNISTKLIRMIAQSKFNPYRSKPKIEFTATELRVIQLICDQCTNKEIADKMGIAVRTVEKQRTALLSKVGAKTIVGVVLYAIDHKLVKRLP
jgi:DNA-binding NarL/FixJ family response regulator